MTDHEPIRARQSWREPVEEPYESLAGVMAGIPRLPGALCRGSRDWDAEFDQEPEAGEDRDARLQRAARSCLSCPALRPCAEWLSSLPERQRPTGVVAGQVLLPRHPRRKAADSPAVAATGPTSPPGRHNHPPGPRTRPTGPRNRKEAQ